MQVIDSPIQRIAIIDHKPIKKAFGVLKENFVKVFTRGVVISLNKQYLISNRGYREKSFVFAGSFARGMVQRFYTRSLG
jgi:hypothetical protein